MSDIKYFFICLSVMAITTYLVRMLPIVLLRKKIENVFLKSFFYYIPYAVLAAMTIPAIFHSTASLPSAIAGFAVALLLAFFERSLLIVASGACAAAFIIQILF